MTNPDAQQDGHWFGTEICDRFEQLWSCGQVPNLKVFARDLPQESRASIVLELAGIDMEYRWRLASESVAVETRLVEDYLREFPFLQEDPESVLALISDEYSGRNRFHNANHAEYKERFADLANEISAELFRIDHELRRDLPRARIMVYVNQQCRYETGMRETVELGRQRMDESDVIGWSTAIPHRLIVAPHSQRGISQCHARVRRRSSVSFDVENHSRNSRVGIWSNKDLQPGESCTVTSPMLLMLGELTLRFVALETSLR